MVLLLPTSIPIHLLEPHNSTSKLQISSPYRHHRITRRVKFCINSLSSNSSLNPSNQQQTQKNQQPRTLFPGGFKRPEIKVPTLILQLNSDDVFKEEIMSYVDVIVSKWVGIVVLDGGNGGGRLYEAACLLKSVIRERAYLLVFERVDIASAADTSGVLLSDQGLPAIVARNMMMESKSKSVVLPLVARSVGTAEAALSASDSEGADFLVYSGEREEYAEVLLNSVVQRIKIPVFTSVNLERDDTLLTRATELLKSGASGLVVSLESMKMFSDDSLSKLFSVVNLKENSTTGEVQSINKYGLDKDFHGKNGAAGFIRLDDREKQFIEMEKLVLEQAISVIRKAAPLMDEVSLLVDAVSQLDDPLLLVIAVIVC